VQETSEQKRTLFTWRQHDLHTYDNGFGEKRSQCGLCNQRFRSLPKAASCPGMRVYNPYAGPGSLERHPETLATVEELAQDGLMPANYQDIKACLHTVNGHSFIALYERKKAIPRPLDAPPAPAEAIKASSVPPKPAEERKPRKPRQRTPPDPLYGEKLTEAQEKRLAQGIALPTTFIVDEKEYVLELCFWREPFFQNQGGWWHYANRWSPESILETVREALPIGTGYKDRRFLVTATWRGETIGKASYHQRGRRDDLSTVALEEATGALADGIIEETLKRMLGEQQAEEDRLAEEERTVPCTICRQPVHVSAGPARRLVLQIDGGEPQIIEIFACEDDAERIRQARQVINIRLFDPTIAPYAYNSSVALATHTVTLPPTDQF
jgi:hypothetical protein